MKINFLLCCILILSAVGLWFSAAYKFSKQKHNDIVAVALLPVTKQTMTSLPQSLTVPNYTDSVADQILALLMAGDSQSENKVFKDLLPNWVRQDPAAAAHFAESPEASKWRVDLMSAIAQNWTDIDINGAEAWASQLSNPTECNMVLGYVALEEANLNPNLAVQVLDNQQMSDDRRNIIIQNLALQWAGQNLQPLYNWIANLPAGQQRDNWFAQVALDQARSSPEQAAQVVSDSITQGSIQDNAALQVLRQWARQDQGAAAAWANLFPAELQTRAMSILAGNLTGAYQVN